jgi:hypothetical protein
MRVAPNSRRNTFASALFVARVKLHARFCRFLSFAGLFLNARDPRDASTTSAQEKVEYRKEDRL